MSVFVFHRKADKAERDLVSSSGELWGRAMRQIAGNGDSCVKAYVGPLPPHETGYTFRTKVEPTRARNFWGARGVVWELGTPGVFDVSGDGSMVGIAVEVIDG